MQTSTVTEKGQITIPKAIRNVLNLDKNRRIIFIRRRQEIVIKAVSDFLTLYGSIKTDKDEEDWNTVRYKARNNYIRKKYSDK